MGKRKSTHRAAAARAARATRVQNDAQYRAALGLTPDEPLPPQIGVQATAGTARGGRGASRRGRGRDK